MAVHEADHPLLGVEAEGMVLQRPVGMALLEDELVTRRALKENSEGVRVDVLRKRVRELVHRIVDVTSRGNPVCQVRQPTSSGVLPAELLREHARPRATKCHAEA